MSLTSFLGGVAKTITSTATQITGISGTVSAITSAVSGTNTGAPSNVKFCPGTPTELIPQLAEVLRTRPEVSAQFASFLSEKVFKDDKATVATLSQQGSEGLATGAVWTAWGGKDCKSSSREGGIQDEIRRIIALGTINTSTVQVTASPAGLSASTTKMSPVVIAGLVVAVLGVGFLLLRKKG